MNKKEESKLVASLARAKVEEDILEYHKDFPDRPKFVEVPPVSPVTVINCPVLSMGIYIQIMLLFILFISLIVFFFICSKLSFFTDQKLKSFNLILIPLFS